MHIGKIVRITNVPRRRIAVPNWPTKKRGIAVPNWPVRKKERVRK